MKVSLSVYQSIGAGFLLRKLDSGAQNRHDVHAVEKQASEPKYVLFLIHTSKCKIVNRVF